MMVNSRFSRDHRFKCIMESVIAGLYSSILEQCCTAFGYESEQRVVSMQTRRACMTELIFKKNVHVSVVCIFGLSELAVWEGWRWYSLY